jgi:DMSO/TMAO reductase YedYZ molybdopterin-dependent catalytic subunit
MLPYDIARDEGILVLRVNGTPLSPDEDAPVRLFVPSLFGWNHVKWLRKIIILKDYYEGYWEALGYHERGLASATERFKVRNMHIIETGKVPRKARILKP